VPFKPRRVASNLAYGTRVLANTRIGSEQGDALAHGLRDEQPVEWIAMNRRKAAHRHDVFAGDHQFFIVVVQEPTAQQARVDLKIRATEPQFDRDFPKV